MKISGDPYVLHGREWKAILRTVTPFLKHRKDAEPITLTPN
jgi:hypothetical protein